jgi:hypothetical protein
LGELESKSSRRTIEMPEVLRVALVKTAQLALGHSSPIITLNTYARAWPDALDCTRALVDAALGAPPLSLS